jgi:hypothetical protein
MHQRIIAILVKRRVSGGLRLCNTYAGKRPKGESVMETVGGYPRAGGPRVFSRVSTVLRILICQSPVVAHKTS